MNRYEPLSGREFPRFSGIKTFFRLPYVEVEADYDIGIIGVPFDGGTSYRPGSRFAPTKVREMSSLGRVFHMSRMESFVKKLKVADIGDCPTVPIDLEQTYKKIEEFYGKALSLDKRLMTMGGDHSITLPILRAFKKKYGKPLRFIHFDAHLDTYPAAWGKEYHHGSFARHAVEEGLIDPKQSLQIGIRGPLTGSNDLDFVKKHGLTVGTMDMIRDMGAKKWAQSIAIPDSKTPTYISYDIDCLDPSCAPGTGTPVPGGLTTYEVQQIFRNLQVANLVGCDVVEVSPAYDQSDITALAAVDALFEMMFLF